MTTARESEQFISLLDQCGVSPAGADWVRQAVDVFHDVDYPTSGMPDAASGRSVIFNVTKNLTITKPSGLPAGDKFDAHIAFIPFVTDSDLVRFRVEGSNGVAPVNLNGDLTATTVAQKLTPGCVQVWTTAVGKPTFGTPDAVFSSDSLGFEDVLSDEQDQLFRLVGAAFEIYNTTEELHKSGSITVYKADSHGSNENRRLVNATITTQHSDVDLVHGPPNNEASAKLMNGITWEAADGCLVPCVLSSSENPAIKLRPLIGGFRSNGVVAGEEDMAWIQNGAISSLPQIDKGTLLNVAPTASAPLGAHMPWMQSGAYLTGLSEETSLVLTVKFLVEVFPLPSNSLVPLAMPSPAYDSKAIDCYSEIVRTLHAGYPVHDNAHGDFFRKALGAVKRILAFGGNVSGYFPGPRAAAISTGLKAASSIAAQGENMLSKSQKRKKNKKKNAQPL